MESANPHHKILHHQISAWGQEYLKTISIQNESLKQFKEYLETYSYDRHFAEDLPVWVTCILALRASSLGNFGVGSIVLDAEGAMLAWGHNEVFAPYFNSEKHAEMVAMDTFEIGNKNVSNIKKYRLFTSIESCPMCLTRLINSGIGAIIHASWDNQGGMVHKNQDLPQMWLELSGRQTLRQAFCSPGLIELAKKIFQFNLDTLYQKLKDRL